MMLTFCLLLLQAGIISKCGPAMQRGTQSRQCEHKKSARVPVDTGAPKIKCACSCRHVHTPAPKEHLSRAIDQLLAWTLQCVRGQRPARTTKPRSLHTLPPLALADPSKQRSAAVLTCLTKQTAPTESMQKPSWRNRRNAACEGLPCARQQEHYVSQLHRDKAHHLAHKKEPRIAKHFVPLCPALVVSPNFHSIDLLACSSNTSSERTLQRL